MAKKLVTQWHVIKRRVSLGMSQISHLVKLPWHLYNLILEARVSVKFETIIPPKHNKAAWTSSDKYCNPFRPLPNCRSFKIKLGSWDPLLALLGLNKRLGTSIDILPYSNRHMNRYAEFQIVRLNALRDANKPDEFWKLAYNLMRHSDTFLILAVNHVFPQWQRRQKLSSVMSWCKKAKKIMVDLGDAHGWTARINFSRRYLLKADGVSWRPLGVPTPAWRLVLHLWAQMFSIWTHTWMPFSQHGFVSGRGTLSAWRDLLDRVKYVPNIYEYDLKDWFNKVRHEYLNKILRDELKIPAWIVERFGQLNDSVPRFDAKPKLDESQYLERDKFHKDPSARFGAGSEMDPRAFPNQIPLSDIVKPKLTTPSLPRKDPSSGIPDPRTHTINPTNEMWAAYYSRDRSLEIEFERLTKPRIIGKPGSHMGSFRVDPKPTNEEWIAYYAKKEKMEKANSGTANNWSPVDWTVKSSGGRIKSVKDTTIWDRNNRVGLPQGAATSPVMSNIALKVAVYDRLKAVLGYADDGLYFSARSYPNPMISHPPAGVWEKAGGGWIKKDGKWLKPLKFLGLEYNPDTDTLFANTRKGSDLELKLEFKGVDLETVIREYDIRHGLYHPIPSSSWEMMIKSNLAGWIQARLYSGYWSSEATFQSFAYTFASQSWSKEVGNKCDPSVKVGIFNSSSVASAWLAAQLAGGSNQNKARDIFGRRIRNAPQGSHHMISLYGKE